MAILTKRETWRKERPANETRRSTDLTPAEQENVRAAIRFLVKRHGTAAQLAEAMGAKRATLFQAMSARGTASAGLAIRAARVARVPLEDVITGAFPAPGTCPYCGRA